MKAHIENLIEQATLFHGWKKCRIKGVPFVMDDVDRIEAHTELWFSPRFQDTDPYLMVAVVLSAFDENNNRSRDLLYYNFCCEDFVSLDSIKTSTAHSLAKRTESLRQSMKSYLAAEDEEGEDFAFSELIDDVHGVADWKNWSEWIETLPFGGISSLYE
jgi:hypothetical protein